jgi:hypothetical protein
MERGNRAAPWLRVLGVLAVLALAPGMSRAENPKDRPYPHGDFMDDCALCHREAQWLPAQPTSEFHHTKEFPLKGAHRTAPCRACHVSLEFKKAVPVCATCHKDVHQGEFGSDCGRCHGTRNFIERTAQIRTHRATRFPLTGAHATLDCARCHPGAPQGQMRFVHTPTDCASCHLADYMGTTDPNHAAGNMPRTCEDCHSTRGWKPVGFDHAAAGFPITGSHRGIACTECHANGSFGTQPPDCYHCHTGTYNGTSDPPHRALGFPTTCTQCHTTRGWEGARVPDHDSLHFPIYSGRHKGTWTNCSDCHTSATTYGVFSCVGCHPHDDKPGTAAGHVGVTGYQYNSQACYSCHPHGRKSDSGGGRR